MMKWNEMVQNLRKNHPLIKADRKTGMGVSEIARKYGLSRQRIYCILSNNNRNISKKLRFEVFRRDDFQCQYCGRKAPKVVLHVDHIKPISKGGKNKLNNLVTACSSCNNGKFDGASKTSNRTR